MSPILNFPWIDNYTRLKMLVYPEGIVDIVLDTDAATEVDDPFAISYALLSAERINVKAIYAAPFSMNELANNPEDGMNLSYNEILKILTMMKFDYRNFVFKGSVSYLNDKNKALISNAAEDLVTKAYQYSPERPLYVVCIGAATNIASALLLEPDIIKNIVILWLAGNNIYNNHPNVYNIYQDVLSAQVVFNSGVPFIHCPCNYVASHLLTTIPELEKWISGKNDLCDYLFKLVKDYSSDHFAWSKIIWDIATIGYLIKQSWTDTEIISAPIITDEITWSIDNSRHLIKNITKIDRDSIFKDMFTKLRNL